MQSENLHRQNAFQQSESEASAGWRRFGGKSPYKAGGMFEGASHIIFENAKHLRKKMTDAEQILWFYLKQGINGFKFRRQHPIGIYIADFYCHKAKLIIEVDGTIHNKPEIIKSDKIRQKDLEDWGYSVIRFSNQEVIVNVKDVIASIEKRITGLNNIHKQNTPQQSESKSPL